MPATDTARRAAARPIVFAAVLAGATVTASAARAEGFGSIYVCRDAVGRTLTSDRPIAACAQQPMRELRADGSLRREIAPPPTAEEREQRQREAERAEREEQRRRLAQARDEALLIAYRDEDALETARERQLARLDEMHAYAPAHVMQRERARINTRFDEDRQRLRELLGTAPGTREAQSRGATLRPTTLR